MDWKFPHTGIKLGEMLFLFCLQPGKKIGEQEDQKKTIIDKLDKTILEFITEKINRAYITETGRSATNNKSIERIKKIKNSRRSQKHNQKQQKRPIVLHRK